MTELNYFSLDDLTIGASATRYGQVLSVCASDRRLSCCFSDTNNILRKYEHSKTFGIIASASSNIIWAPAENVDNPALRSASAGRAVVGANEEVLSWDIKKGELIARWKDSGCGAEVTTVAQSKADVDIHAVG